MLSVRQPLDVDLTIYKQLDTLTMTAAQPIDLANKPPVQDHIVAIKQIDAVTVIAPPSVELVAAQLGDNLRIVHDPPDNDLSIKVGG